jgi:hypothetical protein
METFSKAAALHVFAICLAAALLVAVIIELAGPRPSELRPDAKNYPGMESTWLSPRTVELLSGMQPGPQGIDTKENPFKAAQAALGPADPRSVPAQPEPEPEPPEPATREISLVYRGFYRTSSGEAFVYLEIDKVTRVYPIGAAVAAGWTIANATTGELTLEQGGGTRIRFPFNLKKSLEVPIEQAP